MKTVIISGSHRPQSQSFKVSQYLQNAYKTIFPDATSSILKLDPQKLPLWEEEIWKQDPIWEERLKPFNAELMSATSLVFVCPEYNGMASPAFKNFFLMCNRGQLSHKPALLVSVTSGMGGVYPISELRMSGYKNTRPVYTPDHLIIRYAEKVLNDFNGPSAASTPEEKFLRERIDYSLKILGQYDKALSMVRESGVIDFKTYPNGM